MKASNIRLKTSLGEIFLSSDWSSEQKDHRKKIRAQLYKKTKNISFLNLETLPKLDNFFFSISHCKSLGGYAVYFKKKMGFDIEEKKRITPKVISRISTKKDRLFFNKGNEEFLWVIKEAAFKFISHKKIVMSEMQINTLSKTSEGSYLGTLCVRGACVDFLCGEIGESCIFSLAASGS